MKTVGKKTNSPLRLKAPNNKLTSLNIVFFNETEFIRSSSIYIAKNNMR